jgi:hypothetical protein
MEEPLKKEDKWRNEDGTFKEGYPGGPGRPKGKTLKEWMREKLLGMTEEQREIFLKDIPKDMQWRMAEGNPANATDITTKGKPIIELAKEIIEKNDINTISSDNSEG